MFSLIPQTHSVRHTLSPLSYFNPLLVPFLSLALPYLSCLAHLTHSLTTPSASTVLTLSFPSFPINFLLPSSLLLCLFFYFILPLPFLFLSPASSFLSPSPSVSLPLFLVLSLSSPFSRNLSFLLSSCFSLSPSLSRSLSYSVSPPLPLYPSPPHFLPLPHLFPAGLCACGD